MGSPVSDNEGFMVHVAWFVSPHGFGHAARACAIMSELVDIDQRLYFEIFTTVPQWFFEESLSGHFRYHHVETDIGFVQKDPFREDIEKTVSRLDAFLPFSRSRVKEISETLSHLNCRLAACDVSALGIECARHAGIPTVLVENFTWDWIYSRYPTDNSRLKTHADYLHRICRQADYHIQTDPVCQYNASDLITAPVSRQILTSRSRIRRQLDIDEDQPMVILTTGGILSSYQFVDRIRKRTDTVFLIAGAGMTFERAGNRIRFPQNSQFRHPDLVNASDAVIGKAGYSTLAEVYRAGVPFGYVSRPFFPESNRLSEFIESEMQGIALNQADFENGGWIDALDELLDYPVMKPDTPNGASQAADYLYSLLKGGE